MSSIGNGLVVMGGRRAMSMIADSRKRNGGGDVSIYRDMICML